MEGKYRFFICCWLLLVSCQEVSKKGTVDTGIKDTVHERAEDTTYSDLEGNTIALSSFKGKRILLNFWATWCRPCIEEMPSLLKAKRILENEGYVILLASDESLKEIKGFKESESFEFNYIRYNGAFSQLNIHALPTTFIYNESGKKVEKIVGATDWDSPEMIKKLKEIHK
ncbi:TlpA family protein disulfide reductase [Zobellia alginiliquefaciens]|uniref:TlpA family protein disulfide reductase n=1 Tax=Zobellia alginiliquefaciens TaxID=3032586 RepID=UPI0023E47038|nr:TlpA disulfide reductase family protein [Zobellia alginiliquefaciens]